MTGNSPAEIFASPQLGEILRQYVANSRWFRAKTRAIAKIEIEDEFAFARAGAFILVLKIVYEDGDRDWYILPASVSRKSAETIARVTLQDQDAALYNALADEAFRSSLLHAIACNEKVTGRTATLVASRTAALQEECGAEAPESFVSRAEQSNTSIVYRDRYILKLFRKLEQGINPDVEIGNFLTARGFRNTPAVLGNIEYQRNGKRHAIGLLQQFVPNQGDAWKYTLDSLAGFFKRAIESGQNPPPRLTDHPLELADTAVPPQIESLIGPYIASARLLARRTAEMHQALCDPDGGPDFAPEPFTTEERERLYRDLLGQSDIAFELLRRKQAVLTGSTAEAARQLLHIESRVSERFRAIQQHEFQTVRIRHHGDYHLGQVLFTGRDFMIIDFEGEPARPLAERRAKAFALRDVAGMVRSFQYAAFSALFGQVPGVPAEIEPRRQIEAWAAAWNAYVSAAYLQSYFEAAAGAPFIPQTVVERRLMLDAFLLQKALYEVAYELNNRPDWLQIPLQGILGLMR
ncbi:MAG TPA: putative maltokinase [Bryobacteraceae bacterium]